MVGFAFQRRNERGCGKLFFRKQRDLVMTSLPRVLLVAILLAPVAAYSQSGGGGEQGEADRLVVVRGGSSASGAASGPTAESPSAVGTPSAGSTGAGSAACKWRSERSCQSRRPQQFCE